MKRPRVTLLDLGMIALCVVIVLGFGIPFVAILYKVAFGSSCHF